MRLAVEHRAFISFLLASAIGMTLFFHLPFPSQNALLLLIHAQRPAIVDGFRWAYTAMLFTTPYVGFSVLFSLAYIFVIKQEREKQLAPLPPYPELASRESLFVVVGERHQARKREAAENPQWLILPERGLYTGVAIFGAIGSGKTSCCIQPFAEQILGYMADDPERRAAAIVLEVKGDFCYDIMKLLEKHGRAEDYLEIGLESGLRYNPLYNDLEAYSLAYGIASLLNNLFGKGKEPFWQQAYTNLVKFIILLHKTLYDYVTLFDVYECAINHQLLADRIQEGEELMSSHNILVNPETYLQHPDLDHFHWETDESTDCMKALQSEALEKYLRECGIPFEMLSKSGDQVDVDPRKQAQFAAVKRWFMFDWMKIEPKLRTSVVEGISVFLSLFDDNPSVKHTFCPPKEAYDPEKNKDGKYGIPLPTFSDLIEAGKVIAINFPAAANPGLARTIGTLMKQDFQKAMISRIPQMKKHPERHFRPAMFLCDEYQSFATVGESDPTGDEKFFALSRQAKCIPVVATQSISSLRSTLSGESWRTLLQTFRTKIFLAVSDDFSAKTASDLCGKEEQLKLSYSISESGQDARVSLFTGRTAAQKSSVTASKTYNLQRDFIFEPKIFGELKNAESIVLAYDGVNPLPPTLCYLKPHYLDRNLSYFEQMKKGIDLMSFDVILPFLRPIEHLILDREISEIMVNGTSRVFIERRGILEEVPGVAMEEKTLQIAVKNIARRLGDEISDERPVLDSRLPDGSRVAAIFPPCSIGGTTLTIRKFASHLYTAEELLRIGTMSQEVLGHLRSAISERKNMLVSGGTSTGKTTMLNAVARFIDPRDRIVVIEDTAELNLCQPNLVRFEARREQPGSPAVTIRDLVKATLRHRPDRILLGEVRGAEAFDLLQALNTGHSGTLATIHANSAAQSLTRFASCVLQSDVQLPFQAIRNSIADSVNLLLQIERRDGRRVVSELVEVEGYDQGRDQFQLRSLYRERDRSELGDAAAIAV